MVVETFDFDDVGARRLYDGLATFVRVSGARPSYYTVANRMSTIRVLIEDDQRFPPKRLYEKRRTR